MARPRLVFATTNPGKLKELRALLGDGVEVASSADFPGIPEVVEDADTFEGNAQKKAQAIARATGVLSLADDSGLCVDALEGAPGVASARYAATEASRNDKLLGALHGVVGAARGARFVCVLCLAGPDGRLDFARGECAGRIGLSPRGTGGFGYDPLFELPDGRVMAELSREEKAQVSHRGAAFRALLPVLRQRLSSAPPA